jgi:hypothetical protein
VLAGKTHSLVPSTAAILDILYRVFGLNGLELIVARASFKCHSQSNSSGRTIVRRDACADAIRALLTSTLACGKLSLIAGIWRVKQGTAISLLPIFGRSNLLSRGFRSFRKDLFNALIRSRISSTNSWLVRVDYASP